MKHKDFTGIVPLQYTGEEIEAEASVKSNDDQQAIFFYNKVKSRLLNVNDWHQAAGILSARFYIIDSSGKEVTRNVQKNDYLKIDIPGPGSKEGEGFDWVLVEELKEFEENNIQSIGFRVRPCADPFSEKNLRKDSPGETAHFYDEKSTSNFIVTRQGSEISVTIIDRNIKPNVQTDSFSDKIRNAVAGITAIGMFSKIQWQQLAEGLLSKN